MGVQLCKDELEPLLQSMFMFAVACTGPRSSKPAFALGGNHFGSDKKNPNPFTIVIQTNKQNFEVLHPVFYFAHT